MSLQRYEKFGRYTRKVNVFFKNIRFYLFSCIIDTEKQKKRTNSAIFIEAYQCPSLSDVSILQETQISFLREGKRGKKS